MIIIEDKLTPAPTSVSFPMARVTFRITLSDDEGPADHTLVFALGKDNDLSWEPLTAASEPVKESPEDVRILKNAKVFTFVKRIFGPPSTDLAFFRVVLEAPDTEGSACRIMIV